MHKECIRSSSLRGGNPSGFAKHPLLPISGVMLMVKLILNGSLGTTRCPRLASAEFILMESLQRKARKAGWEEEHVYPPPLHFWARETPISSSIRTPVLSSDRGDTSFLGMKRTFWRCCIPAPGPCPKQLRVGQGRRMHSGSRMVLVLLSQLQDRVPGWGA